MHNMKLSIDCAGQASSVFVNPMAQQVAFEICAELWIPD